MNDPQLQKELSALVFKAIAGGQYTRQYLTQILCDEIKWVSFSETAIPKFPWPQDPTKPTP